MTKALVLEYINMLYTNTWIKKVDVEMTRHAFPDNSRQKHGTTQT